MKGMPNFFTKFPSDLWFSIILADLQIMMQSSPWSRTEGRHLKSPFAGGQTSGIANASLQIIVTELGITMSMAAFLEIL